MVKSAITLASSLRLQGCIQMFFGDCLQYEVGGSCDVLLDPRQSHGGCSRDRVPRSSENSGLQNDLLLLRVYPPQHVLNVSIGIETYLTSQFGV